MNMTNGSKLACYSFLLSLVVVFSFSAAAQSLPGTWKGYIYTNDTLAENSLPVSAYIAGVLKANTSTATAVSRGFFNLEVEGVSGQAIGFQVCGVNVNQENQSWSAGPHYNGTESRFNLTFNRSANSASCTYACGCTGGYCNSGSCASSAPATTTGGTTTGGVGGSSATTTTTTTTSTTAPTTTTTTIIVTQTVATIPANTPTEIKFPAVASTAIESITLQTSVTVSNVQVIVQTTSAPSTASAAISSSSGAVYRYLDVKTVNVVTSQISNAKFKFNVERAWFNANQIDQTKTNLNRLVGSAWVKLPTNIIGGDDKYVFYEAESAGFSIFAITGEKIADGATTTTVPIPTTTTARPATTTTQPATTTLPTGTGNAGVIMIALVFIVIAAVYFYITKKNKGKFELPKV